MLFKRYWVDARVGCVAVRDYLIYVDHSGLHSDDADVAAYWSGKRIDVVVCDHCGHTRQEWCTEDVEQLAINYCDQLNQAYCPNPTEVLTMFRVIRDFFEKQPKTLYLTQQIADYLVSFTDAIYLPKSGGPLTSFLGVRVEYGHEFCIEAF